MKTVLKRAVQSSDRIRMKLKNSQRNRAERSGLMSGYDQKRVFQGPGRWDLK